MFSMATLIGWVHFSASIVSVLASVLIQWAPILESYDALHTNNKERVSRQKFYKVWFKTVVFTQNK